MSTIGKAEVRRLLPELAGMTEKDSDGTDTLTHMAADLKDALWRVTLAETLHGVDMGTAAATLAVAVRMIEEIEAEVSALVGGE